MIAEVDSTEFVRGFGALSREMMATMLDLSPDCVKILDADGRIDFMNENGLCVMEIDDFSALAKSPWESLWPDEGRPLVAAAVEDAKAGRESFFEAFCPTAKGSPRWWEVRVSPMIGADRRTFGILAVSRDVTERRSARESIETMALEMRHRLRNAFAVSGAIALASGREEPAHGAFAQRLAQRYGSLSMVQSALFDDHAEHTLEHLVRRIAEGFNGERGLIEVGEIPALALDEQRARLVALVLGELATNSVKHGALKAGLPVRIEAALSAGSLALEWSEDVPHGATGGDGSGSGHGLMQRMARAHGGSLEVDWRAGGLDARLEVPV